jgi:hypothetical protein
LVDELANITTTRDGKEEMQRCEEIFRQICWLEERFWPNVDGMGEGDDSARLGPGLGPMNDMNSGMNGPMSASMNGTMSGPMSAGPMNGPMGGGNMNNSNINRPNMNGSNMNGSLNAPNMNGPMNGGPMNGGDGAPVGDGRNSFSLSNGNGLDGVGQSP